MGNFRETLGINEFKSKNGISIPKALLAEFLGNLLLNFFGCGSCVLATGFASQIVPPMAFGLTIFVCVQALGHVSGAHLNPAVTAGMLATGGITVVKGVLYVIVQCLGALAGSGILKAVVPDRFHNTTLGNTGLHPDVSPLQGCGFEFMLGFVLVLVVCGVCDQNRPDAKAAGPLAIGLAVALGHFMSIGFTGSSMNPARSFGSAVIANVWDNHWVYWVGPISGGIAAAVLYQHVFKAPSLGPLKIIERYTTVVSDEKELKRLDGAKDDLA